MGWSRLALLGLIASSIVGCASSKPAPAAAPEAPLEVAEQPAEVEPVEVDVPVPEGLDLVLYVNSPNGLLGNIAALHGDGPFAALLSGDTLVEMFSPVDGVKFADLAAPVQLAALEEDEQGDLPLAVSFGLKPGFTESELNEVFDVSRRLPDARARADDRPTCLQHTTANNYERLICAERPETVRRLGPYMKRSALHRFSADVRLEFTRGLIEKSAKEALDDVDTEQSSAEAAGERMAAQLFDSMGTTAVELTVRARGIKLAVESELMPNETLFNTLLVGPPARPMPPSFDQLPEDTGFAFTSAGIEKDALARTVEPLWQAMEADLRDTLPNAQVDEGMPVLRRMFFGGGSLRYAYGAAEGAKGQKASESWWCFGLEEPLDDWTKNLRDAERIDGAKYAPRPGEASKKPKHRDKSDLNVDEKPLKRGLLPKGSMYLVIQSLPDPDYQLEEGESPAKKTTTHVYVTTDGDTTWIVGSDDPKLALAKARHFVEHEGKSKLAGYFRASEYSTARVLGFVTPRGAAHALERQQPEAAPPVEGMLQQLPDQGNAPVHFAYTVGGKQPKRARFEIEFDRDLIAGVVQGLLSSFGAAGLMQGVP